MVSAPKLDRVTVEVAVSSYLRNVQRAVQGHSLSKTTAQNYSRDLAEFVELAGAQTVLDDLTGRDIDDIILAYGAKADARFKPRPGMEPKTRGVGAQARFRQSVGKLFSEALGEGWVEASPMPRSRVRPRVRGLKDVARTALEEPSAAELLQVPGRRETGRADQDLVLRDVFLLRLLMETGPRVSEVCAANRADLTCRADGTWWLHLLGKGAKERDVPVSAGTVQGYHDYLERERPTARARTRYQESIGARVITAPVEDAEDALLLSWRGVRMRPRDVQLMVKRATDQLPPDLRRRATPHGLRHTAATLLLRSGAANVKTVQEILGHTSVAITGIYLDTVAFEMTSAVRDHPVTGDRGSARTSG